VFAHWPTCLFYIPFFFLENLFFKTDILNFVPGPELILMVVEQDMDQDFQEEDLEVSPYGPSQDLN